MNKTISKQESLLSEKTIVHGGDAELQSGKEKEQETRSSRDRLTYYPPDILESMRNTATLAAPPARDYALLKQYEHLRNVHIDLAQAQLTDKQMIAVSLVFYGGLKKRHAARIMKIVKQSLDSHLKLAMLKIERCLTV